MINKKPFNIRCIFGHDWKYSHIRCKLPDEKTALGTIHRWKYENYKVCKRCGYFVRDN